MATHSSVLAWRIPGTREPGELPSLGSHRVGHNWSDLAAAAAYPRHTCFTYISIYIQQIWKTQQWPEDWKRSVFTPIPKKGSAKECSNYCTIALISHTSEVMLKILQDRLQQHVNYELPDIQAGFRKGRGTRDQIANIHWIIKNVREFQRNIYFWTPKSLTVCITTNCGKFFKRCKYQTTWPASSKSVCRLRSNS